MRLYPVSRLVLVHNNDLHSVFLLSIIHDWFNYILIIQNNLFLLFEFSIIPRSSLMLSEYGSKYKQITYFWEIVYEFWLRQACHSNLCQETFSFISVSRSETPTSYLWKGQVQQSCALVTCSKFAIIVLMFQCLASMLGLCWRVHVGQRVPVFVVICFKIAKLWK